MKKCILLLIISLVSTSLFADMFDYSTDGNLNAIKKEVEKGADVNIQDEYGYTPLMLAAGNGNLNIVRYLVENGADIEIQDEDGDTALFWASMSGNLNVVTYLVEMGADIHVINHDGETAFDKAVYNDYTAVIEFFEDYGFIDTVDLIDAIEIGDLETVITLLENGENVEQTTGSYEQTPLMLAANENQYEIVQVLIDNGADVFAEDADGDTALLWAGYSDSEESAIVLVKNGADVNTYSVAGYTPLMLFANSASMDFLEILVEKTNNINFVDEEGDSALFWAASAGKLEVVKLFIENGADIHVKNNYNVNVLETALSSGHDDIAEFFTELGLEVSSEYVAPSTQSTETGPLSTAVENASIAEVLELLENGADVDERSGAYDKTPLMIAAQSNNTEIMEILLDYGADINAFDYDGDTALIWAGYEGAEAAGLFLLERGAAASIVNSYQYTPLMIYSANTSVNSVETLLKSHNNINAVDEDGDSALIWASANGNLDVVRFLVENGADVSIQNYYGETALDEARYFEYYDVVEYLESLEN